MRISARDLRSSPYPDQCEAPHPKNCGSEQAQELTKRLPPGCLRGLPDKRHLCLMAKEAAGKDMEPATAPRLTVRLLGTA